MTQPNIAGPGTLHFVSPLIDILSHLPVGPECSGPECHAFITLLDSHHRLLHRDDASAAEITNSRTNLRLVAAAMDIIHELEGRDAADANFAVDVLDGLILDIDYESLLDRLIDEWAAEPEEEVPNA